MLVDGEPVAKVESPTQDGIVEQFRKFDNEIVQISEYQDAVLARAE